MRVGCAPIRQDRVVTDQRPTIPALLARSARDFGAHAYLITPSDRVSYAEARQRSGELARRLLRRGIGKGTRVGLLFANDVEWVLWWLALSRIGAVVVPLSTLYRPAEIGKVLRLADAAMLIAPSKLLGNDIADGVEAALPKLAGQRAGDIALTGAPYLREILITDGSDRSWASPLPAAHVAAEVLAAAEREVSAADPAVMIHTSGSTADPKGVLHTHGTLVRQTSGWPDAVRAITGSGDEARVLCAMPFFWVGGLLAVTGALHAATAVVTMPRFDAGTALDLVERERVTGIIGWPSFTQQLREHPSFATRDLSSAPMLRDGPLDIAMTDVPDGYPVHRTMTETAGGFAFTDLAIVDETGAPVPEGTVGELLVRGIGVMAGYNKRERWDTFDADGWFHTGDRVYRREGDPRLFYVGRSTDLIKVAGANVSPLEVEAVIDELPAVAQCVVVGLDHPQRGEQVCAVVVPQGPRESVDIAVLTAAARDRLSAYKIPTQWVVTTSDRIPTLPSGKLDRRALRSSIATGELIRE
ncbi:class I adenylate-forming enzyme family protein [Mycobacterium sp. WMMD1722]|uniref:class I adenylate-forming enzyme family protein n=1 Tax=Mycobacterium sp. WMMD1722 TaxID=3404117 RepID=UPI003BF5572E